MFCKIKTATEKKKCCMIEYRKELFEMELLNIQQIEKTTGTNRA